MGQLALDEKCHYTPASAVFRVGGSTAISSNSERCSAGIVVIGWCKKEGQNGANEEQQHERIGGRIAAIPTVTTVAQPQDLSRLAAPRPWRPRPARPSFIPFCTHGHFNIHGWPVRRWRVSGVDASACRLSHLDPSMGSQDTSILSDRKMVSLGRA